MSDHSILLPMLRDISDILDEFDIPRSGIKDIGGTKYPKSFLEQTDLRRMRSLPGCFISLGRFTFVMS